MIVVLGLLFDPVLHSSLDDLVILVLLRFQIRFGKLLQFLKLIIIWTPASTHPVYMYPPIMSYKLKKKVVLSQTNWRSINCIFITDKSLSFGSLAKPLYYALLVAVVGLKFDSVPDIFLHFLGATVAQVPRKIRGGNLWKKPNWLSLSCAKFEFCLLWHQQFFCLSRDARDRIVICGKYLFYFLLLCRQQSQNFLNKFHCIIKSIHRTNPISKDQD